MRPRSSILLSLLLLALSAAPAVAQLTFAGTSWGTSRQRTADQIAQAGYRLRGVDQDGDWVFGGPDGAEMVATFDVAGLVAVEIVWREPVEQLPLRYARLADSLRTAFGAPAGEGGQDEQSLTWKRGDAELSLYLHPRSGGVDSMLSLRHVGAAYEREFERRVRAERAQMELERVHGRSDTTMVGDWRIAFSDFRQMIRVDTVRFTVLGRRMYGARFLDQRMQTRRLENGMMYNAVLTEVELDCARTRTRLLRTTHLYGTASQPPVEVPRAERRWLTPPPGTPDARALRSACEALARQPGQPRR